MEQTLRWALEVAGRTPPWMLYLAIGLGTAAENVFPPVPSDTFVLAGGVLSEVGILDFGVVFALAWSGNVILDMAVYGLGRRHGEALVETRWGRRLLRPRQLGQLRRFYRRHGTVTLLVSQFLPGFRVTIPAFAGVSRLGVARTALALAVASAVWYGLLLAAAAALARNVPRLVRWVTGSQTVLWAVAALVAAGVAAWWWRSRRGDVEPPGA